MTDTANEPATDADGASEEPPTVAAPEAAVDAPAEEPTDTEDTSPQFRIMLVAGVEFHLPSPAPVMELRESENPYRTLEIPIALPEAQALGQVIHAIKSVRPSTHELFSEALFASGTEIVAVRITRCENGVYYAELDLMAANGRHILDCRASDGVILALRQSVSAPILCDADVLAAQKVR